MTNADLRGLTLPCPFCGGECDAAGWRDDIGRTGPECETCGATANSIDAWNRRAALSRLPADAGAVAVFEPTEEMQEAGRSAVMARDCAGPKWTPRQHYDASGNDALIAATPDWILDCKGPLPKHIGALLVWYAMHSAAPPSPPVAKLSALADLMTHPLGGCSTARLAASTPPADDARDAAMTEKDRAWLAETADELEMYAQSLPADDMPLFGRRLGGIGKRLAAIAAINASMGGEKT